MPAGWPHVKFWLQALKLTTRKMQFQILVCVYVCVIELNKNVPSRHVNGILCSTQWSVHLNWHTNLILHHPTCDPTLHSSPFYHLVLTSDSLNQFLISKLYHLNREKQDSRNSRFSIKAKLPIHPSRFSKPMKQWQKSSQWLNFLPSLEDVAKAPTVSQHIWYLLLQFGYFDIMIDTAFCWVSCLSSPLKDNP